jgi:hypothetical protein
MARIPTAKLQRGAPFNMPQTLRMPVVSSPCAVAVYGTDAKTPITDLIIDGNGVHQLKKGSSESLVGKWERLELPKMAGAYAFRWQIRMKVQVARSLPR